MLTAAHSITAGVAGGIIGEPFAAFLVGFFLHFVLDSIPHFDTTDPDEGSGEGKLTLRQWSVIIGDALIGLYLIFGVLRVNLDHNVAFFSGALGGVTPDLLDNFPLWKESFRRSEIGGVLHHFHDKIQRKRPGIIVGILTQVIVIIIAIYVQSKFP